MRILLVRAAALLGMLAICLGILVPAMALPCPQEMPANACTCCDKAMLASGPSCGFACQPGAMADAAAAAPALGESAVWFDSTVARLVGASLTPDAPPPR